MTDGQKQKNVVRAGIALLRNLVAAGLLYSIVFGVILLVKSPTRGVKGKLGIPAELEKSGPADILRTTRSGVQVKFAASSSSVTINPHANVFNRPMSLVVAKDDYLGPRPHVDTEADLQFIANECRGSYDGMEKIRNIFDCLQFLAEGEEKYFKLPVLDKRASQRNPKTAEYFNADGADNTMDKYVEPEEAIKPTKTSLGTCPGPIIPFHTYWTGQATWRLEVFIKSYLYTQNLACSRLFIWLDEDRHLGAVTKMMEKDPLFARFLPFVQRGDITLKAWNFPSRIPMPKHEDNTDGIGYYKNPSKPNLKGESTVADGLIVDSHGQQWLMISPRQMAFLPQSISDALRFVVLHLHGGVFFEVDVLMLRDMRPLLTPEKHNFAGRWAAYSHPGDFNTAVMSLTANSSLSSYLIRGGVRMGLNFHPRVIGRMAWKDGRDLELTMLETAAFDPLWTEVTWGREGRCSIPCLREYSSAFKGKAKVLQGEWESYGSPQLQEIDLNNPPQLPNLRKETNSPSTLKDRAAHDFDVQETPNHVKLEVRDNVNAPPRLESTNSFAPTSGEEKDLRKAGAIADYQLEEDKYPPNNRTLENFYRGAWSYHVHNQVCSTLDIDV
jgi:hypothetical protein